jgi:hypothetical protein
VSLNTAPLPPVNFISRPEQFNRLIEPLLRQSEIRTMVITTALQGGGGFGKTTLAQAICHDRRITGTFATILWIELGQTPQLVELLNNQIALLDEKARPLTDINAASARLRELLTRRQVLLVLDDVWQETDITPFVQIGPDCTHLITTRRQDIVAHLNARPVDVNEMTTEQAADLLASGLPERPAEMGSLRELAAHLGE